MNKKEIYERIVQLTAELAKTGIAKEIFSSADAGDAVKTQEIIDDFPKEYPELNDKIVSFGEELNKFIEDGETGNEATVFGTETDKEMDIFAFDTNVIDPFSFYALTIFAKLSDNDLFVGWDEDATSEDNLFNAFEDAGYEGFVKFLHSYTWTECIGDGPYQYPTIGDLLAAAFAGMFE